MGKVKILHSEAKDYCAEARAILNSFAKVDYKDLNYAQVNKSIAGYDGLIVRLHNKVDKNIMAKAPRLKMIASPTTGTNHIDEDFAKRNRIKVVTLKGERAFLKSVYSTAENTFALILALLRNIPLACNGVKNGQWYTEDLRGQELHGKTLGIVGYGRLGRMVAKIALGFGMNVIFYDVNPPRRIPKNVKRVSLNALLAKADIVTLHIPLTKDTRNFINAKRLKSVKKGACLINTSRGDVIDEKALLRLLKSKHLNGAALDVLQGEEEPTFAPRKHPLVQYAKKHNNLIITPHISGAAKEAVDKTDVLIAQKIKKEFQKYGKN